MNDLVTSVSMKLCWLYVSSTARAATTARAAATTAGATIANWAWFYISTTARATAKHWTWSSISIIGSIRPMWSNRPTNTWWWHHFDNWLIHKYMMGHWRQSTTPTWPTAPTALFLAASLTLATPTVFFVFLLVSYNHNILVTASIAYREIIIVIVSARFLFVAATGAGLLFVATT